MKLIGAFSIVFCFAFPASAADLYRWTDPETGQVVSSPTPPPYPIKEQKPGGNLPNGSMINVLLDTDSPTVKAAIAKRKAREAEQQRIAQERAAREAQERAAEEAAKDAEAQRQAEARAAEAQNAQREAARQAQRRAEDETVKAQRPAAQQELTEQYRQPSQPQAQPRTPSAEWAGVRIPKMPKAEENKGAGIALLVVVGLLYFVPTVVAIKRKHRNATAIIWLNILAGWSGLGWLVAFIWALTV